MRKRAVDTNVLVRLLADDGSAQSVRARELLLSEDRIVIAATVVLETEWVLRSRYKSPKSEVNRLLTGLLGLPNVEIENRPIVARALPSHRGGMDFADALHLASCFACDEFLTFDLDLTRHAEREFGYPRVLQP